MNHLQNKNMLLLSMDAQPPIKTVLIVEDDIVLSRALAQKFKNAHFSVQTASNGNEGLLLSLSQHPDIIILDLLMPIKNGMSFMEDVRKDNWGKSVPIIVLTNFDTDDFILSKLLEYKPAYYLIKSNTSIETVTEKAMEILTHTINSQ